MRKRSSVIFFLLAAAGLAQPQMPRADERPASVEGEVRNAMSGMPIERAHVSLRRFLNGGWDRYGAQTTADGKFTILGIAPGNYQVALDRVGYVVPGEVTRGQLTLRAEEKKSNYKLKLIPVGSITGRVLDPDGAPMEGISVEAEMAGKSERSGTTDDRGQYRIGGLRPGKYRVRAKLQTLPFPPEIRTDGTAEVNYAATYHPAGLDQKSATPVAVGAATDVIGIDIRMVAVPILRVSGKVSGVPEGVKPVMVQIQQGGNYGANGGQVKPDGSFEVWRLSPGKYTAIAVANNAGEFLRSVPVDFEIGGSDIENIELRVLPAEDIKGQLEFDDEMAKPRPPQPSTSDQQKTPQGAAGGPGSQQPQAPRQMRRIILREASNQGQTKFADVGEDGSFTLEKVGPGKYNVVLSGYPAFVKSVRLGQTTEDGPALDLRYGANGASLTVALSSAYATISGVVNDDKGPYQGARVVVRDTNNRNITNAAMSAADGTYKIKDLPPGKYKLLVLDEGETNLMTADVNLDDFDDRAETLELRPKEALAHDLRLRTVTAK